MQNTRIAYYDIVKSIGIFLVVVGHAITNDSKLGIILYSFHMPLFFIISGMVLEAHPNTKPIKVKLVKLSYQLLLPYFIWGLVFASFSFKNVCFIGYGSWWTLKYAGSLSSLWFLPVSFLAKTMVVLLMFSVSDRIVNKTITSKVVCTILLLGVGAFTKHTNAFGWPWSIDVAFMAAGFMCLGMAFVEIYKVCHNKYLMGVVALTSSCIFALSHLFIENSNHFVLMANADYGNIFLFALNSVSGSLAILSLSYYFSKHIELLEHSNKTLLFIGQNTLPIFILHKPFLELGFTIASRYAVGINTWWFAIPNIIIAFCLSVILSNLIGKICPQIIGK